MIVQFEGRDWDFAFEAIDVAQARYISNTTGLSLRKLFDGLGDLDPAAAVATYWAMKTQNGQVVDANKVNFPILPFIEAVVDGMRREAEERPTEPGEPTLPGTSE